MKKNVKNIKAAENPEERSHLALKRTIGIISLVLFVALFAWITIAIGKPLITSMFEGENGGEAFAKMVDEKPIAGRLIYIGVQILQVFIAFIPGEAVEIAGGLAFGAWEGLGLSLLGVAIGSSIIFMLSKTLGMKFVRLFVSDDKINNLAIIRNDTRLNSLVFLIFFLPGTPKDALTYVVGLTRMKLHTFLLISLVARIPSVLTSTWGGDKIMQGEYVGAIIIFAITGILGAAGMLIYRSISKKNEKSEEAQPEQNPNQNTKQGADR